MDSLIVQINHNIQGVNNRGKWVCAVWEFSVLSCAFYKSKTILRNTFYLKNAFKVHDSHTDNHQPNNRVSINHTVRG